MGWDGECVFEEEIEGRWVRLAAVEIRALVFSGRNILDPSFMEIDEGNGSDVQSGAFLWSDFVATSADHGDMGYYRSVDDVINQILDRGNPELAQALLDNSRRFRCRIDSCH